MRLAAFLAVFLLVGCFESVPATDAGADTSVMIDTSVMTDTAIELDSGEVDSGVDSGGEPDTDREPDTDPPPPPPLRCESPLDLDRLTACTEEGARCYQECTEIADNPANCLADCDENATACANCITTSLVNCANESFGCEPQWVDLACCLEDECGASIYNLFDRPSTFRCFSASCTEEVDRWNSCASDVTECVDVLEATCGVSIR